MADETEHEHDFVHVVYKEQKLEVNTYGTQVLGKGIVEVEKIKIYCTKCGESKSI